MKKIFIPSKGKVLDFDGFERSDANVDDSAIVRMSNGKFALAEFSYRRFTNDQPDWAIYAYNEIEESFDTAFEAFIHYGIVSFHKPSKRWVFARNVVRI